MTGPRAKASNVARAHPPKDEPIDPWAFQTGLEEILTGIQSAGFFAVSKTLNNAPNPGLCVEGLGSIGLPPSNRDAEALLASSHGTPFGKTWELPASVIHLKNPAWTELLNTVVQEVSRELGVDESGREVKAELHKLLLSDEGGVFKPHQAHVYPNNLLCLSPADLVCLQL